MVMSLRALLVWFGLLWPLGAQAAPDAATVTILDGSALLIRDATTLALAEGVRLNAGDIIETGTSGRLLRIEFADGVLLDLGPESRMLLTPRLSGDKNRPPARLHLLRGVVKMTAPKPEAAAAASLSSLAFDVISLGRSAVFMVQPDAAFAFAESGEVNLQDRAAGKLRSAVRLPSGEFLSRVGPSDEARAVITPRPTPAFIQRLPKPFMDSLPARAEHFKSREVEPRRLGPITYDTVSAWLAAEGLRAGFVVRWKALARDAEFRKGLIAHLRAHPEWDRTLFPEKYLPKPAAGMPGPAVPTRDAASR